MGSDTAERILEACIRCFADQGYSGTTTRTLAAAAGVNVSTLAYHYGDKEGLYRASIDRLYERFLAVQPDLSLLAAGSLEDRLAELVRFAYRFVREHQAEVRLLLRHVMEHGALPVHVREGWTHELLGTAEAAWSLIGLPDDPNWKLKLLALNHLISRFGITQPEDLAPFVAGGRDPHDDIEELLITLARDLLLG